MKRKIIASVLGIAGMVAMSSVSYGQGFIMFQNYDFSTAGAALNAPITYSGSGVTVGQGFVATLMYSLDGGATYEAINPALNGNTTYPTTFGFSPTTADGDAGNYAGYFFGNAVEMADYTSGSVTFMVQVYKGASYGAVGSYSGESAPFTVAASGIATGTVQPGLLTGLQPFTVSLVNPVPEPATMALAGLGGLGMLMAFRRKKA